MIVATFDIEATNLTPDFGVPIGFVFKQYVAQVNERGRVKFKGKRTIVDTTQAPSFAKRGVTDDRWVLRQFVKCWNAAHLVVGYNSRRYDVPFINNRLLRWQMQPLGPKIHLDIYRRVIKWDFITSRRSLAHISRFVQTHARKDQFIGQDDTWIKAAAGDVRAIHKIVREHCVRDVDTLEEVYHKLIPYISSIRRW